MSAPLTVTLWVLVNALGKAPESPFLSRESRLRAGQHPTKFTSLGTKAERGLILPSAHTCPPSVSALPRAHRHRAAPVCCTNAWLALAGHHSHLLPSLFLPFLQANKALLAAVYPATDQGPNSPHDRVTEWQCQSAPWPQEALTWGTPVTYGFPDPSHPTCSPVVAPQEIQRGKEFP